MGRILVVDDEIKVCTILKEYLSLKGYETHTASSGEEAVEKVKKVKPHIVLLDIIMPGMGGIKTLQEIKKIEPDIGVIMISAILDEALALMALEMGAYDYITKPFDLHHVEMVVTIRALSIQGCS